MRGALLSLVLLLLPSVALAQAPNGIESFEFGGETLVWNDGATAYESANHFVQYWGGGYSWYYWGGTGSVESDADFDFSQEDFSAMLADVETTFSLVAGEPNFNGTGYTPAGWSFAPIEGGDSEAVHTFIEGGDAVSGAVAAVGQWLFGAFLAGIGFLVIWFGVRIIPRLIKLKITRA